MRGANDSPVPVVMAEHVVVPVKKRDVPLEYVFFQTKGMDDESRSIESAQRCSWPVSWSRIFVLIKHMEGKRETKRRPEGRLSNRYSVGV